MPSRSAAVRQSLKWASNSEKNFAKNTNRSMDQKLSGIDYDKKLDFVHPKQKLDSFRVDNLKEMQNSI